MGVLIKKRVKLFGGNIKRKEWNYFITILLLESYFKINSWLYEGILGGLVKISSNIISFWMKI